MNPNHVDGSRNQIELNGITSKIHVGIRNQILIIIWCTSVKYHHVIRKSLFGKQESAENCWNQTRNQAEVPVIPNHVDKN